MNRFRAVAPKPFVKLCGQTRAADIEYSFLRGADFCGVVVQVPSSPRTQTVEKAKELLAVDPHKTFVLTADADDALYERIANELHPGFFQLTANEPPQTVAALRQRFGIPVFKSVHLPMTPEPGKGPADYLALIAAYRAAGADGIVLDTKVPKLYGGSGQKSDWGIAEAVIKGTGANILLAGGIGPHNAAEAAALRPWGIDLASGVEEKPGVKSRAKIDALFAALKGG